MRCNYSLTFFFFCIPKPFHFLFLFPYEEGPTQQHHHIFTTLKRRSPNGAGDNRTCLLLVSCLNFKSRKTARTTQTHDQSKTLKPHSSLSNTILFHYYPSQFQSQFINHKPKTKLSSLNSIYPTHKGGQSLHL